MLRVQVKLGKRYKGRAEDRQTDRQTHGVSSLE